MCLLFLLLNVLSLSRCFVSLTDRQGNRVGSLDSQITAIKALLLAGCPAWPAPVLQAPRSRGCSARWREGRQTQREPPWRGANGPGRRKMGPDQLAKSPALSNSPHSGRIKSQMRTVRGQEPVGDKGVWALGRGLWDKKGSAEMLESLACRGQLPPRLQAPSIVTSLASCAVCWVPGPGGLMRPERLRSPALLTFQPCRSIPGPLVGGTKTPPLDRWLTVREQWEEGEKR